YFVGTVLQFQLHSALCKAAGQFDPDQPLTKPLYKCDIYRSKEAGKLLKLNGRHIRDYFRPLEDWLRNENLRTNEFVGWSYDGDYCKQSIETAGLQVRGGYYNKAPSVGAATASFVVSIVLMLVLR
ncbi:hypothetical protein C0J52_20333, partial [Blattella germanica]